LIASLARYTVFERALIDFSRGRIKRSVASESTNEEGVVMTMTSADLDVRPLTGALGAEIRGVDLRSLDERTWATIHRLWLEYLVVFFPDQQLQPEDHIALGRRFGEIEIHPFLPKLADEYPEIIVLDTMGGGVADAEVWHTDVTFSPTPPMASILRMDLCANKGGDTIFTNQHLAYETLSAPVRDLLEGLTAVHTATAYGRPEVQAEHPAVRIHPETGRRSLFVNRGFTSHIPQLRRSESDALLSYLYAWSERPPFQCRYRWEVGGIGIWDNRATQHLPVTDYEDRRRIQRVTVLGDAPVGGASRWSAFEAQATRVIGREGVAMVDERTNSIGTSARSSPKTLDS
jgi:taurine dioxygenase